MDILVVSDTEQSQDEANYEENTLLVDQIKQEIEDEIADQPDTSKVFIEETIKIEPMEEPPVKDPLVLEAGQIVSKVCILCGNFVAKDPNCRLYLYPRKIPNIYKKWITASKLNPALYANKDIYTCQNHFPPKAFSNDMAFVKSWATPSINLPEKAITPVRIVQKVMKRSVPEGKKAEMKVKPIEGRQIRHKRPKNVIGKLVDNEIVLNKLEYSKTFDTVSKRLVSRSIVYNGTVHTVTKNVLFKSNFL